MKDSNYIKIFTGDTIIVKRIVVELESIDISPIIKDQTESARLGGFGGGNFPGFQEVFVHKDELEKATKVIDDITSDLETS